MDEVWEGTGEEGKVAPSPVSAARIGIVASINRALMTTGLPASYISDLYLDYAQAEPGCEDDVVEKIAKRIGEIETAKLRLAEVTRLLLRLKETT